MQLLDARSQNGEKFKDVAEIYESVSGGGNNGQCLIARTEQLPHFRELGPPDLVYIVKGVEKGKNSATGSNSHTSPTSKEVGSYHNVLGNDNSSSASIAAYINSLTYSMETSTGWFRSNPWSIIRAVYCSWDAFSEVDVRVEAKIPGGVTAYALSSTGQRVATTTEMWQSVFVSGMLRSIYYSDISIPALRHLDPFPTEATESKFLDMARKLFSEGISLGSEKGQPHIDFLNNFLARGIIRYFVLSQRPSVAVDFYHSLSKTIPSVNCLLAESQLAADMENKAVQTMHQMITKLDQRSASMLALEASFLLFHKNELISEGIELAKESVKCSPLDTTNWLIIIEGFLKEKRFEEALLALNNTPMVGHVPFEVEMLRFLNSAQPGSKLWQPRQHLDSSSNGKAPNSTMVLENQGDSVLEKLKAPLLKGLVAEAYYLLVKIYNQIGWDELLQLRSQLFLMEEDCQYKTRLSDEKAEDTEGKKIIIHAGANYPKIDSAEDMEDVPLHIPTTPQISSPTKSDLNSSPKRLCERWLDNLFMILFEDLRVLTVFRSELAHHNSVNIPYTRTMKEWLILGDLADRLGSGEEARDCWRRIVESEGNNSQSLKNDLSYYALMRKAWIKLLKMYVDEGRVSHALTAAARISSIDLSFHFKAINANSDLGSLLLKLIRNEGLERVKVCLAALNLASPVDSHLQTIICYSRSKLTIGHDY